MALVVLEIAWLLWSHPILTGLIILLFTTPLFHIVLFFTPLLVSTALCVIALVSIGPQIEKIREERQFKMSLLRSPAAAAAPAPAPERPSSRIIAIRQGRPQRPPMRLAGPVAGNRRWSDWVRGIEFSGQTIFLSESHLMREISEEGLKSEPGEGIPIVAEDFHLGFVSSDPHSRPQRNLREEELPAGEGQVTAGFDDEVMLAMAAAADDDRDRLMGLVVPVLEESTAPHPGLFPPSDAHFILSTTTTSSSKRKKKISWFRRRRIPCISKALGKLRDRICNQLRRIFT